MRVLYCGDTTLDSAAAYLGGLITHWGWTLDYIPGDQPFDPSLLSQSDFPAGVFIFSDYPAAMIKPELQQRLLQQVEKGAGLIMVGGWESYHGNGGNWDGTPIGQALPVTISSVDDRVNCDRPVLVAARKPTHPILNHLPWPERPPIIGGFNRFTADTDGTVLLEAVTHLVTSTDGGFELHEERRDPLLVTGQLGAGRVVALATDVAPHWVGPLVDWGDGRVSAQTPAGDAVEVGELYAQFLKQLIEWAAA